MASEDDTVSVEMAGLSVDGDAEGEDGLVFGIDDGVLDQDDLSLCLVGRFLTSRPINFNAMEHTLAALWQPFEQVSVRREEGDRYVFQFYHSVDVQRVLDMRPCTFNNHLLVLEKLEGFSHPSEVPLTHVPFWIQVHGLPSGFFSERVVTRIGNELGVFMESDPYNFLGPRRAYVRLRYKHDLSAPIHKSLRMRKSDGAWFTATFAYERAPSFCFICGLFDHTEKFCRELLKFGNAPVVRKFGPELRANHRRPQSLGSRWLKGGGGEQSIQGQSSFNSGNFTDSGLNPPPNAGVYNDHDMERGQEDLDVGEDQAMGLGVGVTIVDPKRRRIGPDHKKVIGERSSVVHGSSSAGSNQSKNGVAAGPGV